MLSQGISEKDVAIWAIDRRNQLKVLYRGDTSASKVREAEERNIKKYGNPIGPNAEFLQKYRGKSWSDIIKSASKPDGTDMDLSPKGFNR